MDTAYNPKAVLTSDCKANVCKSAYYLHSLLIMALHILCVVLMREEHSASGCCMADCHLPVCVVFTASNFTTRVSGLFLSSANICVDQLLAGWRWPKQAEAKIPKALPPPKKKQDFIIEARGIRIFICNITLF